MLAITKYPTQYLWGPLGRGGSDPTEIRLAAFSGICRPIQESGGSVTDFFKVDDMRIMLAVDQHRTRSGILGTVPVVPSGPRSQEDTKAQVLGGLGAGSDRLSASRLFSEGFLEVS